MSKRRINWNPAHNVDVDAWRERQIHKSTLRIIEERNAVFRKDHEQDSDEELREYVRSRALRLGYTPHPLELPGGLYIQERLGDWGALTTSLGLRPVGQDRWRKVYSRLRKQGEERFAQERKVKKMFKALTKDQQEQVRVAEREQKEE